MTWQTEAEHSEGGAGWAWLLLGVLLVVVILVALIFITRAAAEQEQARAYAVAAEWGARTDIARQEQETARLRVQEEQATARLLAERRAELMAYGLIMAGVIVIFCAGVLMIGAAVYGLDRLSGIWADRRAELQEQQHRRLLEIAAEIRRWDLEAAERLALPATAAAVVYEEPDGADGH